MYKSNTYWTEVAEKGGIARV